jgi:predicted kinase
MQVKIMSGVSGAGKSTFIKAQNWGSNCVIHSADNFFMLSGEYKFDARKLSEAHGACLRGYVYYVSDPLSLRDGSNPPVQVVDNTNTTLDEIAPYYALARAYGYDVELITLHVDTRLAVERTTHNVPRGAIEAMRDRIIKRNLPFHWNLTETSYIWHNDAWLKLDSAST